MRNPFRRSDRWLGQDVPHIGILGIRWENETLTISAIDEDDTISGSGATFVLALRDLANQIDALHALRGARDRVLRDL